MQRIHRLIAAGIAAAGLHALAAPVAADAEPFAPRLSAGHPDVARVRGAVEAGFAHRVLLSEFPLDGRAASRALDAAGPLLLSFPDGDGLSTARSLRLVAPYAEDSEPPIFIADPLRLELRGSDLFEGERGVNPYRDGDWVEEGVHGRAGGALASPLSDAIDVGFGARLESGRTGTRVKVTNATLAGRWRGMELVVGRQSRWWGPGVLTDVLLTNNALPLDAVAAGTDGYQTIGRFGAFSARVMLAYLNDGDRFRPYPLVFGHRMVWQPVGWVELGAARTIMLGGGDRTKRYNIPILWDIFLGKGENRFGFSGLSDTDQKAAFEVQVYLYPLAKIIPGLLGGRFFYEYGGDDSFEGLLPTTVAHHYGGSLVFPYTRIELELFENTAFGLFYWNDEYPSGYTNQGLFMGSDLGWDSRSGRARVTRSIGTRWGVRAEVARDSRGHRFRQGDDLRPERLRLLTVHWEGSLKLTRRMGERTRASIEYRHRSPDGFSFDNDRNRAEDFVGVTVSTP